MLIRIRCDYSVVLVKIQKVYSSYQWNATSLQDLSQFVLFFCFFLFCWVWGCRNVSGLVRWFSVSVFPDPFPVASHTYSFSLWDCIYASYLLKYPYPVTRERNLRALVRYFKHGQIIVCTPSYKFLHYCRNTSLICELQTFLSFISNPVKTFSIYMKNVLTVNSFKTRILQIPSDMLFLAYYGCVAKNVSP